MSAPREHVITTRDGAVTTRALVAGEGPPVVYLHGMEGLQWDDFLDGLAERNRVHAIEHVGSGTSTGLEEIYDLWDLVGHYEEALDQLGLQRTALVGHSFGGMVAAEVAAQLRDRITSLVLLAPLGLWDDALPVAEIDAIEQHKRPQALLSDPSRPLPKLLAPELDDHEALFNANLSAASINQFTWPIPEKGLRRRLYRVTAPTLLLWGSDDRIVDPAYSQQFARHLTHAAASVLTVADLGHLLHHEDHQRVLDHVLDHLNGSTAARDEGASEAVVVTSTVRAKSGCADELEWRLAADAATRADEPGNVAFMVARSTKDPQDFLFYEVYADPAAHAEHRRLTRSPDDAHRGKNQIADLVDSVVVTRGSVVFDSTEPARR